MVRALREMGAMRVRVGDVDVVFAAPALSDDTVQERAEATRERSERDEELDATWSAP